MSLLKPSVHHRRPQFHPLPVVGLERLTDRAVAVTFGIPDELREIFAFQPGQHLTLRAELDGADVRRSYSICMSRAQAAATGRLRIASNEVEGGAMSTRLNHVVAVGDRIEVLAPLGDFVCPTNPAEKRHIVAVAAGSGITPVISVVRSVLEDEPGSRVTLVFGNRTPASTMFAAELAELAQLYGDRFDLVEVFSRVAVDDPMRAGRIDGDRLERIVEAVSAPIADVDEWFLCGPIDMVHNVRDTLPSHGIDPARIHHEEFFQ
ncbi:FAD-binding oxidoreductase [Flexivirga caeni]|nr:FAD-binding oxidoreductase [Flexivirga caeni]